MFMMISDWGGGGQCSADSESEEPGQAGEVASQELNVLRSSWVFHSMKDVQSLVEVTKLAKDLEHVESQK